MKRFFTFFLAGVLILTISNSVFSQQIDIGFGTNGFVTPMITPSGNPFATDNSYGFESIYFANGQKTLSFGNRFLNQPKLGSSRYMLLAKFNYNGTPDASFGNNGIKGLGPFIGYDVVQQADEKIVAVGYLPNPQNADQPSSWKIYRFESQGILDTTFGTDGSVTKRFSGIKDIAQNVAIQNDGKIIVSGISQISTGLILTVVARFNSDGTLDLSFGPYGEGFIDFYDSGSLAKDLAIQPDGKIILAGDTGVYSPVKDVSLVRLTRGGILDTTFGNNGAVYIDFGKDENLAEIETRNDGKIIVCGNTVRGSENSQFLFQLEPNGNFDSAFGENGKVINDLSILAEETSAMTLRANGNIVVEGKANHIVPSIGYSNIQEKSAVRLTEFDVNGKLIATNFTRLISQNQVVFGNFRAKDVIALPDGKISITGDVISTIPIPGSRIGLYRFSSISGIFSANSYFDFDYDGRDDISILRQGSNGKLSWWSLSRLFNGGRNTDFGEVGDIPAPGDYNGDLATDLAVFRPSTGEWFNSTVNYGECPQEPCFEKIKWGLQGDIPASGDFDGDGRTDRTVFRPSDGTWYILNSSGGYKIIKFGLNGDLPVTGDYDGDGRSDLAVIRSENGKMVWYIYQSSLNNYAIIQFGLATDKAVIGDYNGDRKTDIAVWRPETGDWYVLANYSEVIIKNHGVSGDIPIPADYDNDKVTDFAVFTPSSATHKIILSANQETVAIPFGLVSDFPTVTAYVRGF